MCAASHCIKNNINPQEVRTTSYFPNGHITSRTERLPRLGLNNQCVKQLVNVINEKYVLVIYIIVFYNMSLSDILASSFNFRF